MTPQEYTLEIAKRLHATSTLVEGLLWCAVMMRSWNELDAALKHSIRTAEHLRTSPVVPDLRGEEQAKMLNLRHALVAPGDTDWRQVEQLCRALATLLRIENLPTSQRMVLDLFKNRPPLVSPLVQQTGAPSPRRSTAQGRRRKKIGVLGRLGRLPRPTHQGTIDLKHLGRRLERGIQPARHAAPFDGARFAARVARGAEEPGVLEIVEG